MIFSFRYFDQSHRWSTAADVDNKTAAAHTSISNQSSNNEKQRRNTYHCLPQGRHELPKLKKVGRLRPSSSGPSSTAPASLSSSSTQSQSWSAKTWGGNRSAISRGSSANSNSVSFARNDLSTSKVRVAGNSEQVTPQLDVKCSDNAAFRRCFVSVSEHAKCRNDRGLPEYCEIALEAPCNSQS